VSVIVLRLSIFIKESSMNTKYLMQYLQCDDELIIVKMKVVEGSLCSTYEDLKMRYDPENSGVNVEFYPLGVKLEYKQGD
jgi:hypothetical protein